MLERFVFACLVDTSCIRQKCSVGQGQRPVCASSKKDLCMLYTNRTPRTFLLKNRQSRTWCMPVILFLGSMGFSVSQPSLLSSRSLGHPAFKNGKVDRPLNCYK